MSEQDDNEIYVGGDFFCAKSEGPGDHYTFLNEDGEIEYGGIRGPMTADQLCDVARLMRRARGMGKEWGAENAKADIRTALGVGKVMEEHEEERHHEPSRFEVARHQQAFHRE